MKVLNLLVCLFGFFFFWLFLSCDVGLGTNTQPKFIRQHCGNCHLAPAAGVLTKDIWATSILPRMADYFSWDERSAYAYANASFYTKSAFYPMNDEIWTSIIDYYTSGAMEATALRDSLALPRQAFFEEESVELEAGISEVTSIYLNGERSILVGSGKALYKLDSSLDVSQKLEVDVDIIQIIMNDTRNGFIVGTATIDPHEGSLGKISRFDLTKDTIFPVITDLKRPVQMLREGDITYVSQFGFKTGAFTIHDFNNSDNSQIVHSLPGTYRIKRMKLAMDRPEELVISISQAQEGIYVVQKNKDAFQLLPLVRFPPEYGLSDLDVYDINGDGLDDFVIVNGDNADYSPMPKAYHGVEVYLNKGNYKFKKAFSYQIYGPTQARFIDVNGDGAIDFIISCYFSEHPDDRIVVFINDNMEELSFTPYSFQNSSVGRWMVLETGDVDNDGDIDVALGSYLKGPMANKNIKSEPKSDLLVLFNKSIEK